MIKFKHGEIGHEYSEEELDETLNESTLESMEEDLNDNDNINDNNVINDEDVPVSKDGIPLNKEGVCSPAEIKIRSVKEGGRPNPKRLQLITISSPKAKDGKNDDIIDENDLNLILDDTVTDPLPSVQEEKSNVNVEPKKEKKRVPFVTLSSGTQ